MAVKYQLLPSNDRQDEERMDFSSAFSYSKVDIRHKYRSMFTYTGSDPFNSNIELKYNKVSFWERLSYWSIIAAAYLFSFLTMPFSLWFSVKVIPPYQRLVIFRLGRLLKTKGPGMVFFLPWVDHCHTVDMRTRAFNVPPQQIIVANGAAIEVGADIYLRVIDVQKSVTCVQDLNHSVRLLVQLAVLKQLAKRPLEEIESQRSSIDVVVQEECNKATFCWGVEISRCEL